MRFMKTRLVILGLITLLQACTQVDNYILGKDNTPKPTPLTAITQKATMTVKWSAPIGTSKKSSAYLKLKPLVRGNVIYTADASGLVQATDKTKKNDNSERGRHKNFFHHSHNTVIYKFRRVD